MRSMTGFGRGIVEKDNRKVTVDIKTVNHKLLDLSIKSPRAVMPCDDVIRNVCKKHITRGHVDVFVNYLDSRDNKSIISVDLDLAKRYVSAASELSECNVPNDLSASTLLRMPDVLTVEMSEDDEEEIKALVSEATELACENLIKAREKEGLALKSELNFRMENLSKIVGEIDERAPVVGENYAKKLKQRMEEILAGVDIDESRFLTEVAVFVDKSNIDEEITRLKTHIAHGFCLLEEKGEVGKKLDFLVQEINREINTTGSKSNDIVLTQKVLAAKNELEKFREQVQNIE